MIPRFDAKLKDFHTPPLSPSILEGELREEETENKIMNSLY